MINRGCSRHGGARNGRTGTGSAVIGVLLSAKSVYVGRGLGLAGRPAPITIRTIDDHTLAALPLFGSFPAHDVGDVSALYVVHEAGNDLQGVEIWLRDQEFDVFAQRARVIVDRQEGEVGPGPLSEVF